MSKYRNAIVVSGAIVLFIVFTALAGYFGQEEEKRSFRYNEAYDLAKEYGKSDFYARIFAEKADEGKDGVYAEAYAHAMTTLQTDMWDKYTDGVKLKFAQLYAGKRYEGKSLDDSAVYAMTYCNAIPALEKLGRGEA